MQPDYLTNHPPSMYLVYILLNAYILTKKYKAAESSTILVCKQVSLNHKQLKSWDPIDKPT